MTGPAFCSHCGSPDLHRQQATIGSRLVEVVTCGDCEAWTIPTTPKEIDMSDKNDKAPKPRPLIVQPPDEPVDSAPIVDAIDQADVVMLLRNILDAAERGKVVSVAIAGVLDDGNILSVYKGASSVAPLIGAVSVLHLRMAAETLGGASLVRP